MLLNNNVALQHKMPLISSLTALRFFAALMVFCSHMPHWIDNSNKYMSLIGVKVFSEGYIGVTFFFILSGFILTYNYDSDVKARKINTKGFLLLRLSRIYPTHFLTFLITLVLTGFAFKEKILPAIFNLTLIQSFVFKLDYYFSFNAVSWSISDELFFYIICCFLLLLPFKKLVKLCLGVLIVLIILVVMSVHYRFSFCAQHWVFYICPLSRSFDFMVGIILAKIFMKNFITIENKYSTTIFTLIEIFALTLLIIFFYIAIHFLTGHFRFNQQVRYDIYYVIPMGLLILTFAFEKGWFSKMLRSNAVVFLGEISFSMYMFHYMIIIYLNKYLVELLHCHVFGALSAIAFGVIFFSVTIIASALNYSLFEMPLNKFFRKKFKRIIYNNNIR